MPQNKQVQLFCTTHLTDNFHNKNTAFRNSLL